MIVVSVNNVINNDFGSYTFDAETVIDSKSYGDYIFTFYTFEDKYYIARFDSLTTDDIKSSVFDITSYVNTASMHMVVLEDKIILCHNYAANKHEYLIFNYFITDGLLRVQPGGMIVSPYDIIGNKVLYLIDEPLARIEYKTDEYFGDICIIKFPKAIKQPNGHTSSVDCSLMLINIEGVYQSRDHYIDPRGGVVKNRVDKNMQVIKITDDYKFIIQNGSVYFGESILKCPAKIYDYDIICCIKI